MLLGAALGVIRTLHGDENLIADVVPADYVISTIVAAAWHVGTTKIQNDQHATVEESLYGNIPIFNYVSGVQNPLKWSKSGGNDPILLRENHNRLFFCRRLRKPDNKTCRHGPKSPHCLVQFICYAIQQILE